MQRGCGLLAVRHWLLVFLTLNSQLSTLKARASERSRSSTTQLLTLNPQLSTLKARASERSRSSTTQLLTLNSKQQ